MMSALRVLALLLLLGGAGESGAWAQGPEQSLQTASVSESDPSSAASLPSLLSSPTRPFEAESDFACGAEPVGSEDFEDDSDGVFASFTWIHETWESATLVFPDLGLPGATPRTLERPPRV